MHVRMKLTTSWGDSTWLFHWLHTILFFLLHYEHLIKICTGKYRSGGENQTRAHRLLCRAVLGVGGLAASLQPWGRGAWMTLDYSVVWCRWESIKHMLLEGGSGSFSCCSKPADCGYGKYIPIMFSLCSQCPCCFSHCFYRGQTPHYDFHLDDWPHQCYDSILVVLFLLCFILHRSLSLL